MSGDTPDYPLDVSSPVTLYVVMSSTRGVRSLDVCCPHQGVIERDQIVFQKSRTRGVPIVMLTSGGYLRSTARIIADSILNLHALGLISCDAAENAPGPEGRPARVPTPHSSCSVSLVAVVVILLILKITSLFGKKKLAIKIVQILTIGVIIFRNNVDWCSAGTLT